MPTYTYKCKENEHIFDLKRKFSDPPLTECPQCGSSVRKVVNSVGIVFKGSGFYVTDNRSKSANGSASKSESKSDKNGETKSESKAETKSESKSETKSSDKKSDSKPKKSDSKAKA